MQELTLNELVDGCLSGDQDSWNRIVERYAPLIWAIARSHRLGPADCADVSQSTWLRVVQHLDKLRSPERLAQWISTSARRESLKHLEKSGRSVPVGGAEAFDRPESTADLPEDVALARERDDEVLTAFCALSPKCQALLGLLVTDPPMSYDEIGETLGMPRGSLGPVRARCLARLEKLLGDQSQGRLRKDDAALVSRIRAAGLRAFAVSRRATPERLVLSAPRGPRPCAPPGRRHSGPHSRPHQDDRRLL
ncbi:sigma-70 family RNA polymerase sigma factor [Streptomyces sp. B1866]|uniref:RNA polymerase sigma factor n=1 Tax=Streptomyces sp. B1866 TaxID=3075431 RepID=UPI00288EDC74|nr:sigma-70 family RNA polymerase sigma factor [Streptomyces sp. B1866]MDT3395871.1 sigma-70 family RNA polymerase sigma factor [Streptomyces sp. B1866]